MRDLATGSSRRRYPSLRRKLNVGTPAQSLIAVRRTKKKQI